MQKRLNENDENRENQPSWRTSKTGPGLAGFKLSFWLSIFLLAALLIGLPGWLSGIGLQVESAQPVSAASDPVIAAAGDIACDPADSAFNGGNGNSTTCRQKYTANLLINSGLAAVLDLGDNQYYCGGYEAFLASYDLSWGKVKSITHPAVGNHEYLTSGGTDCTITNEGATGYFNYFGSAAGTPGQGYYSFNVGSWHLIALNSNCGDAGGCTATSPQGKWLIADLKAHSNFCTLAYWHIPLYSSGGRAALNTQPLWQILYDHQADLVLSAHDHIYERFAPQDANGNLDMASGLREFVVGTGGANHTAPALPAANSEVINTSTFGVLKLTLHPNGYDWKFVPEAGASFTDSGSAPCHGPGGATDTTPPTAPSNLAAASVTSTQVGLTWTASTDNVGVAGYRVIRDGAQVGTTSKTSFTDSQLQPQSTHTYTVTAYDAAGMSSPDSNALTVTTLAPPPTPTPTLPPSPNFSDGFESGTLSNWNTVSGLVVQSQVVASGSFAALAQSSGRGPGAYARKTLGFPESDLYYQVRFQVISQGANPVTLIRFLTSSGASLVSVYLDSQGQLGLRNDVTGARAASTFIIAPGAWNTLQVHVRIANKASLVEVGYKGAIVNALSRTDNLGSSPAGQVQLGENASNLSYAVAFDDVAVSPSAVLAGGPIERKIYIPLVDH